MLHGYVGLSVSTTSYKNADKARTLAFLVKGRDSAYDRLERIVTQTVEERLSKIGGSAGNREEPVSLNFPKPYIS